MAVQGCVVYSLSELSEDVCFLFLNFPLWLRGSRATYSAQPVAEQNFPFLFPARQTTHHKIVAHVPIPSSQLSTSQALALGQEVNFDSLAGGSLAALAISIPKRAERCGML